MGRPDLIGTTVSHYEILERIGRGGMGVVYKASDIKLDRLVALKFLPPALRDDETALGRFMAEARAASALDHPNICTIYEIGQTESGETFIAMAYYEGETLSEKIQRGPIPVEEAVDYATQIARGLAKAHEAGIVHRDMKPANVTVTSEGVAKILDFGLARVENQQLTRTGELLGTLDYMSPEQIEGKTADPASDVWSVSGMLYEMLTGRRPFKADNHAAVLYSVLHEEPEDITASGASISAELAGVVRTCLEKDASRRFADAGQLLDHLESGEARPAPRRWVVGGLATAALGILLMAVPGTRAPILSLLTPELVLARTYVAVLPQMGSSASDNVLTEGLTHELTAMLSRLGSGADSLWVVPAADIVSRQIRTAPAAHEAYGVNAVLTVSINRLASNPEVLLDFIDPTESQVRVGRGVALPMPGDPRFQDTVPVALANLLGLDASPRAARVLGNAPAAEPNAYNYYVQGKGYLARYDIRGNPEAAARLFRTAIDHDSSYAPAHGGLCEALWQQWRQSRDASLTGPAMASCADAERLAGDQLEVLVPIAAMYLRTGRTDEARTSIDRAITINPTDAAARRWSARVYDEAGEDERAEAEYREAIDLDAGNWIYHNEYGTFLVYRSRLTEAATQFDMVRSLTPESVMGPLGLSYTLLQLNQTERAETLLTEWIQRAAHPRAYSNLGYLYLRDNEYANAITWLDRGLDEFPEDVFLWRHLAHALHWGGDAQRATRAWETIVDLAGTLLDIDPSAEDYMVALAEAHIQLDDPDRGRGYLDQLADEPKLWLYNVYEAGRAHEMVGNRAEALAWIGRALEAGFDPVAVDQDPWLAELRREPDFLRLRAGGR